MKKHKIYNDMHSFLKDFGTDEQCFRYLYELKWDKAYSCRSCGHDQWGKGRKWHYRKCRNCQYDESATAHTLFQNIKFPLHKAFFMIHQVSTLRKGMSTCEMARQHDVHQNTAWYFKRKIQEAMSVKGRLTMTGCVEMDETVIGGADEGAPGRSSGTKDKVVVALEVDYPEDDDEPTVRGASAEVIEDYSSDELTVAIDSMVSEEAAVTTDGWKAYVTAVKGRVHVTLRSSNYSHFRELNWYIFNMKNWLRTIHQGVSTEHLARYLNEFNYRFNNRNYTGDGLIRIVKSMMNLPYLPRLAAVGDYSR